MQKYDIHVCLVSGQAAPNLLPVLDENFKPKQVILLTSQKMKNASEHLAKVLEKKQIKAKIELLKDEFNFGEMEEQIIHLAEAFDEQSIAVNITGGTKLMSIATQSAFSLIGKPIFYVDTDTNRILFISKDENGCYIPSVEMNVKNDLDTYLSSYGGEVLSRGSFQKTEKYLPVLSSFIKQYDFYKNNIPLINKFGSLSKSNGYKYVLTNQDKKVSSIDKLLSELHSADVIDYQDYEVNFRNYTIFSLLTGGWLEDYAYSEIKSIKHIQDIAINVNVANAKYQKNKSENSPENKGNKNEFDIAFLAKNKLHIIECKTQLMDKHHADGAKADDILYKLETIKDYGGFMTKKCLVSYFEVSEAVKNRAKSLNIEIIQGKDIQRLKTKIQEWIAK